MKSIPYIPNMAITGSALFALSDTWRGFAIYLLSEPQKHFLSIFLLFQKVVKEFK
jgi:hypothetical protein